MAGKKLLQTTAGSGTQLPDNFPGDIPVRAEATILYTMDQGDALRVALDSSDALEDIRARYESAFSTSGWQGDVSIDNSTVWTSDFRKDQLWVGVSMMVRRTTPPRSL